MEILIKNPELNTNLWRHYSHFNGDSEALASQISRWEFTPSTHPKVIELCAGDAPLAAALTKLGWDADKITCVDICHTETPLVEGVSWKYIDLNRLGRELIVEDIKLPIEIEEMKNKYDLVTLQQGEGIYPRDLEIKICEYFVKPEGRIFIR